MREWNHSKYLMSNKFINTEVYVLFFCLIVLFLIKPDFNDWIPGDIRARLDLLIPRPCLSRFCETLANPGISRRTTERKEPFVEQKLSVTTEPTVREAENDRLPPGRKYF